MILQEVTLLKRLRRLKAAKDLLDRAGYAQDAVPSRPTSLDSRLLVLSTGSYLTAFNRFQTVLRLFLLRYHRVERTGPSCAEHQAKRARCGCGVQLAHMQQTRKWRRFGHLWSFIKGMIHEKMFPGDVMHRRSSVVTREVASWSVKIPSQLRACCTCLKRKHSCGRLSMRLIHCVMVLVGSLLCSEIPKMGRIDVIAVGGGFDSRCWLTHDCVMQRSRGGDATGNTIKLHSVGRKTQQLPLCKASEAKLACEHAVSHVGGQSSPTVPGMDAKAVFVVEKSGNCLSYSSTESCLSGLPTLARQRNGEDTSTAVAQSAHSGAALHVIRAARKSLETMNPSASIVERGKRQSLDNDRLERFRCEIDDAASAMTSRLSWLLPLEQQRTEYGMSVHSKPVLVTPEALAVQPPPVPRAPRWQGPHKPDNVPVSKAAALSSSSQDQHAGVTSAPARNPASFADIPSNSPQDLVSLMEYVPPAEIAIRLSTQIHEHEAAVARAAAASMNHSQSNELVQFNIPRTLVADSEIDAASLREASDLVGKTSVIIPLFQLRKGMKMPSTALPQRFFQEKVVPLGICQESGQGDATSIPHWDVKSRQWKL